MNGYILSSCKRIKKQGHSREMKTGYFNRILLCGAETWTTTKREDSKVQAVEMKFLRAISNKQRTGQEIT
jgi:hypothetical protein